VRGEIPVSDAALIKELGRELKRGRLEAGYPSQLALARVLKVDRSVISRAESGARSVLTDALMREWCQVCGLDYARLATLARAARGSVPDWFEGWRDVEARSVRLGYCCPLIMPPIARTEAYVRAVLSAGGTSPSEDQVAAQLARASVLGRAEIVVVVHELALWRFVGSPAVMAEQLRHLAAVSDLPSVHVHVVPNDRTVPGMSGAFSLAYDLGVVHMDGIRGRTTSEPDAFRDAAVLFERIRSHALPCDPSRVRLLEVAEVWERIASAGGSLPFQITAAIASMLGNPPTEPS
jgi:transcriptional regulator with XRE-family HTH domain